MLYVCSAWYRDSKVCYVILTDVQVPIATSLRGYKSYAEGWFIRQQKTKSQNIAVWDSFQNSRWWSRGWTLQELLAPKNLVFFARDWSPLGDKIGLSEWILSFTTIHRKALQDASSIPTFSIAQRMSWAADRRTTVPEDIAYCLLGIFDINMPMLYGQGYTAFLKLQEEIIKVSNDHSILAWDNISSGTNPTAGLATAPSAFRTCGDVSRGKFSSRLSYSITNLGISMKLDIMKTTIPGVILAGLDSCRVLHHLDNHGGTSGSMVRKEFRVWIPLATTGHAGDNTWVRAHRPFSKTFLEHQFQSSANITSHSIFILTTYCHPLTFLHSQPQPILSYHSPEPSGILSRVGFGEIDRFRSYVRIHDVREFTITTLRSRRPGDVSHQLVSCGELSVLVSALWDDNGHNFEYRHVIIQANGPTILETISSRGIWMSLLDRQTRQAQTVNEMSTNLSHLHKALEGLFSTNKEAFQENVLPLIIPTERQFQDFRGRSEIVLSIIFRHLGDMLSDPLK